MEEILIEIKEEKVGSYVIDDDGNIIPNEQDGVMKERSENNDSE